ncbi:MAG: FprA family A-type flavoprotein [Candidatus Aminicenantaceae bacterium]
MPLVEIKPNVYWIGIIDRTTDLFEGIWPILDTGVSYNSYLIDDEKKAIIDLAKSNKGDEFFAQIEEITDISQLDYIVINHMEPDHSGLIKIVRRLVPEVKIVGSQKTRDMLEKFFKITENVIVVEDGDTLSLGKHELKFFSTPFLHWPETIMTYETTQRILFSCDAFGGYGAVSGGIFDDECQNRDFYEREALRYYVNIIANFSTRVLSAIDKLKVVPLDVIAPSHGLVWRADVSRIISLYKRWAEYASGECEPGVTLLYASMYGSTEMTMNAVARGVSKAGLNVEIFDAARTHVSYILPSLWTKSGVIVGAPTYEVSLFPPVAEALHMVARKRILNKRAAYFGGHGWSGGALRELKKIVEPLKWEIVDALEYVGIPKESDLAKAERFGEQFARDLIKD